MAACYDPFQSVRKGLQVREGKNGEVVEQATQSKSLPDQQVKRSEGRQSDECPCSDANQVSLVHSHSFHIILIYMPMFRGARLLMTRCHYTMT